MNVDNSTTAWGLALGGALLFGLGYLSSEDSEDSSRKEGFWGIPGRTVKVDREVSPDGGANFYSVPSNYNAALSPRFASAGYGPYARTEMQNHHPAVAKNPLDPGCAMASGRESFTTPLPGHDDMVSQRVSADGQVVAQPITYDRFMFANRFSRLRGLADHIRGDLAITPRAAGWFSPSVDPALDLHQGAMNVMGGMTNDSNRALAALVRQASGKSVSTIGGVDLRATPGVPSYELGLSAGQGDVQVTAFR